VRSPLSVSLGRCAQGQSGSSYFTVVAEIFNLGLLLNFVAFWKDFGSQRLSAFLCGLCDKILLFPFRFWLRLAQLNPQATPVRTLVCFVTFCKIPAFPDLEFEGWCLMFEVSLARPP
jgi:hypothetical protein